MINISKILALGALVASMAACDPEVSRVAGETHQEFRRVSCNKTGYCYTCLPGFEGKLKCGLKFSALCPGQRTAYVDVTPEIITYESGRQRVYEQVKILSYTSGCR